VIGAHKNFLSAVGVELCFALAGCQQSTVTQFGPSSGQITAQGCSTSADVCVSPAGAGQSCTAASPCSLATAQIKVRQLNSAMSQDVVVELLGGLYQLSSPLQFTPQDSGTEGYTVRYIAATGATPVLSGGIPLQGWSLHDAAKNIYQASVPAGFDTRQLYVNGVRAQRARLVLQASAPGIAVLGAGAVHNAQGYQVTLAGMTEWANVQNIEAVMTDVWVEMRCPVSSISPGQIVMQNPCWTLANTVPSPYPSMLQMGSGLNWLENAYAFLTEPGQYYLDRSANVMYYIPRASEDMGTADIEAAGLEQLITGTGTLDGSGAPVFVQNLSFEGLTFAYATWLLPNTDTGFAEIYSGVSRDATSTYGHRIPAAVTFSRAKNISFVLDTFLHLGGSGLNFDTGSQDAIIQGNVFSDLSGGAITLGDPDDGAQTDPNQQNIGHSINNNYINNTGAEYQGSSAILAFYTANTVIEHNEVANTPYTGLSLGWGWGISSYTANNQVTNNHIHSVMQTLFDGGAIYTDGSGANTSLQANYLESVGTTGKCTTTGTAYAGYSAIYHDSNSTLYNDSQNVIDNVSCSGYWVFLQAGDTNDTLTDDYVDVDRVEGCPGDVPGTSSCLDADGNSVTGLTVFGASFPSAAETIINNAGLSAQYSNIKRIKYSF
jgi:Right handed beta helix region